MAAVDGGDGSASVQLPKTDVSVLQQMASRMASKTDGTGAAGKAPKS